MAWKKYPGGALMEMRNYHAGRKTGIHKGWWENGKMKFLYHFKNDMYHGAVQEWTEEGRPFRFFNYYEGQEEGLQRQWWPDGAVRANYVVRDGEQFGIIGRKICKNEK
jgi:antitoxin component YwqK of YwqJK toxin-antitoxin module